MRDDEVGVDLLEHDAENETYLFRYSSSPSVAVAEVLESIGADPGADTAPVLYEVIETDALDALLETSTTHQEGDLQVSFSYMEYRLTIDSDGIIQVTSPSSNEPPNQKIQFG